MMGDRYLCPVCGYPDLYDPPWTNDSASYEICPSCGTQFGYDDFADGDAGEREVVYRDRRRAWRAAGCPWFSTNRLPPAAWNPEQQLQAVEE